MSEGHWQREGASDARDGLEEALLRRFGELADGAEAKMLEIGRILIVLKERGLDAYKVAEDIGCTRQVADFLIDRASPGPEQN